MATKSANTLPIPAHVQSLIDALETIKPAHWTARHGKGRASSDWMIYSEVFRARIDDLKLGSETTRGGYRVGILVELIEGKPSTSFFLFDCSAAARRFKANFRSEMVESLMALECDGQLHCIGTSMRHGKTPRDAFQVSGKSSFWIQQWLNDPAFYNEQQLRSFQIQIGLFTFNSVQQIVRQAASFAAAYLPLLECMVPLEGEPIALNRQARNDKLRPNLARVTGPVSQCSCEHRKIDGLDSRLACGGQLEAAHIKPYQQGGTDDPSNGLWLCSVHHCQTEARIEGNRLSVRLLDHVPQQRHSKLAAPVELSTALARLVA
jgi:hypothetical protein